MKVYLTILFFSAMLVTAGCIDPHPSAGDVDGDGVSTDEGDCDDYDVSVYPGAEEICDGKDNDCNGIDDDPFDLDGDGISAPCEGDCDDNDASIYPNAEEICDGVDNNCSGRIDDAEGADYDQDGVCEEDGDCDDDDPTVYPGATEYCNGLDNDCDGIIDNGYDYDGDGWSSCGDDCDDTDPDIYPGAPEDCDGRDDDCDGLIDEDFDNDGDGWAGCSGDCDDTDPDVNPDMPEQCNGIDDNCNGQIDEEVDEDEDGYTPCGGDCNDLDADIHPGALDGPDSIDNDCDSDVDEFYGYDLDAAVLPVYYEGAANARVGSSLAGGGDITDDGLDDFTMGAPFDDGTAADSGTAAVVEGDAADWFTNPPLMSLASEIDGTVTDSQVGATVAMGDLDDDGVTDVIIGGPYKNYSMVPDGEVYIFLGGSIGAGPDVDDADVALRGSFAGEHAGAGLSSGGDVDGDGRDDVLIGATWNNEAAGGGVEGAVYVLLGRPVWSGFDETYDCDAQLVGSSDDELLGGAVAIVPDMNSDGYDEVLVGSEDGDNGDGRAYLIYGKSSWSDMDLDDADAQFYASGADHWGIRVGGLEDINGDGRGEMWIGSEDYSSGGGVALYFGSNSEFSGNVNLTSNADVMFQGAGGDGASLMAAPGDMDDDGHPDVLIGAPLANANGNESGAVYFIEGHYSNWGSTYTLTSAPVRIVGAATGDRLGTAVVAAGDLNDDGYPDAVTAAPYNDDGGSQAGTVYVLYGY